ncbi:MAG: GtrA family protein [Actinomycetes bacterium]
MLLTNLIDKFRNELGKFGLIGLLAYIIDLGIFNALRYLGGEGPLYNKPLTAKVISVLAATTFAYFGNRNWTFSHRTRTSFRREYILFFVFNGIGMVISLTCLWVSHYLLGFKSALADNVSANVIGLVLGTIFRFWGYHNWVFPESSKTEVFEETLEDSY